MTQFFTGDPTPLLKDLGVDISQPGFYDDPRFVAQEQSNPAFLDCYASFVRRVDRTAVYDQEARARIRAVCDFLYNQLATDGRLGACVDISMGVSRFLELLGVWNYCAQGGMTIEFHDSVGLSTIYLAPVGGTQDKATGHAWVVAPPFEIVDISIGLQPYKREVGNLLPHYILADSVRKTSGTVNDWLDPDDYMHFVRRFGRKPTMTDLQKLVGSDVIDRSVHYGVHYVDHTSCKIKYLTCGVSAPNAPFERMACLQLNGSNTTELWAHFLEQYPEYRADQS
ncbi:MAG TPA: hypothetical protein DER01_19615 [Phycisphaerales bacterium]|nr:hypothetical protein [Phycisphaerales bacterium]|tara:strand:+ start:175 stop:1020 length:846 start_codon:yes stop_codon:yes gene_type:complete